MGRGRRCRIGWGVNLTRQGDTIFATGFAHDLDHTPLWLVGTAKLVFPEGNNGALAYTVTAIAKTKPLRQVFTRPGTTCP